MANRKKIQKAEELVVDTTPKRVRDTTHTLYDFPCDSTLKNVVGYLEGKLIQYGEDATISITGSDGDDYFGSNVPEVTIQTYRDEFAYEIERRLAKAKKDKERAAVQRVKRKEKEEKEKKKQAEEEMKLLKKLQEKYKGYGFEQVNTEG